MLRINLFMPLFLQLHGTFLGVIATIVPSNCYHKRPVWMQTESRPSRITGSHVLTRAWWVSIHFCAALQLDKLTPLQEFLSKPIALTSHLPLCSYMLFLLMSSSKAQFCKLSAVKQRETTTVFYLFAFSVARVEMVTVTWLCKEKRRLLDLEEIIHGCSSEELSYHALWQVCGSKHIPARLELDAAPSTDTIKAVKSQCGTSSRSQRNPGNVSKSLAQAKFVLKAYQSDLKFQFWEFFCMFFSNT